MNLFYKSSRDFEIKEIIIEDIDRKNDEVKAYLFFKAQKNSTSNVKHLPIELIQIIIEKILFKEPEVDYTSWSCNNSSEDV